MFNLRFRLGQRASALLAALLLAATTLSFGQIDAGSIAGTVTDSSGNVVQGAQITASESQSGTSYNATTSSSGYYVIASARPGTYKISVTAPGFGTAVTEGVVVSIGTRAGQDIKLQVGGTTQSVEVTANGPGLDTESSDVGTVISSQQVLDLPLAVGGAFRSLSTLAFLAPGAVGPGTNGGTAFTKIGGGQTEGSDFLIDGISTLRSENGTENFDQTTPSVDSIEEFRLETVSLPAYLGRTTGGLANFKSRSGTNSYHGVIYDFYKNAALDANNWFNNGNAILNPASAANYRRPPDTKNDYGVNLGGPIVIPHLYNGRDKTFFFFNFEQLLFHSGGVSVQTVPTLAQRNGDFSSTLGGPIGSQNKPPTAPIINPCTGQPVLIGQIFDPNTTRNVGGVLCRTPFSGNQVPIGRSALAQKVLALIPVPNFVGTGTANFNLRYTDTTANTAYTLRIDQNIGTRTHLFGFVSSRENSDQGSPTLAPPLGNGNNLTDQYYKYLRAGWDFTVTPHVVNELTIGGNRVNSFNNAIATKAGLNYDQQLGIPNTPNAGTTFPVFNLGEGLPQLGSANYDDNVDNGLIANEGLNIQKGSHGIRLGGTYRWQQFSYINSGPAAGNFAFGRAQTAGTNDGTVTAQSGNGVASFLLGVPANITRTLQLHNPRWISTYYAAYLQDDWKVHPNFTLNLGVRWSLDTPRHEAEGDTSSLNPTAPNAAANGLPGVLAFGGVGAGRNGNKSEAWAGNYYKNVEPRVGFSWSPSWLHEKVVVRGAYSIVSGPLLYSDYGQGLTTGFTANSAPSTLNNGNGFLPFGPLDAGPNPTPTTPNLDPLQRNGQGIDYVAKKSGRPSTVQNWSLEQQLQLAPDLIFTLGYLGEHSVRLRALLNYPNDINPADLALGNLLTQSATSPAAQAAGIRVPYANFQTTWGGNGQVQQALRPFPQFGYINTDSYLQNTGQSTYHALEAKIERRFRNGLNLLASYTFSKTLTDADSIQPFFATTLGQGGTQNPYNLKAEKAVSTQDVPNNFVVSYLYELPVGKGKKLLGNAPKAVNAALGGWRVGGIQRYLSGQPISFFGAGGIPGFDNGIRFNRVPGIDPVNPSGHGRYNPFAYAGPTSPGSVFNRAAFVDPNANRGAGAFQFGTMPRNSADIRTPTFLNEDFNLNKNFPIHESVYLEFRAEAFDAFNRHIFAKPDSGPNDVNFGQVTGLISGPRNLQVVLKIHY